MKEKYVKEEIDSLIAKKSDFLDNNIGAQQNVGNAMHYPMIITINGDNASLAFIKIRSSLKHVWRNSYEKIVFTKIDIQNEIKYIDFEANNVQDLAAIADDLANISNKDYFREVSRFCFYNIIDTSCIKDFDEFKQYYTSVEAASRQINRSIYSLAIILLDEKNEKSDLSTKIKSYLKANKIYDGQVVLATKTKASYTLKITDLFDTVSSLIIISNNDADTSADDESYRARLSALYSGDKNVTLTAAYSVQKRPTVDIVKQMISRVIESVNSLTENPKPFKENDLRKILKIEDNGSISELEKIFDFVTFSLDYSEVKYLPYKMPPKKGDLENITYREFGNMLFEGAFDQYVIDKCKDAISNNEEKINNILSEFDVEIKQSISAWQCLDKDFESTVKKTLENYNTGELSQAGTIEAYFKSYAQKYIRQNVFLSHFRKLFADMKENANNTVAEFNKFKEVVRFLNIKEESLGNLYKAQTDAYTGSIDGEKDLQALLASGNGVVQFIDVCDKILDGIVKNSSDIFALSFIDEWVKRMGQEQNAVLSLVQEEFKNELESQLFYYTVSPYPTEFITLYTFHIGDKNWHSETPLYREIKSGINEKSDIYFINVGYDYKVEALKLFDITEIL